MFDLQMDGEIVELIFIERKEKETYIAQKKPLEFLQSRSNMKNFRKFRQIL